MFDFGIVTTCRNMVSTIDETIWSVISQEGGHTIRYHIQDAVSTDGTLEKIKAWEKRINDFPKAYPSNIIFSYSSETDSSMYEGIDKAFRIISPTDNTFVGWLNADDILWAGTINAIVNLGKEQDDVQWVTGFPASINQYGKMSMLGSNFLYPQKIMAAELGDGIHWRSMQQESTFWRYGLYRKTGGLNKKLKLAGDWDLWRRFAEYTAPVHVLRQLGAYRLHAGQLSSNMSSYLGEIESVVPAEKRAADKQNICPDLNTAFDVCYSDQNDSGEWILNIINLQANNMTQVVRTPKRTMHLLKVNAQSKVQAPLFNENFDVNNFTYLRSSHVELLSKAYLASPFGAFNPNFCDLKAFQDAFCTAFIDQKMLNNSKILEIGGGNSRILPMFQEQHECWNIDKFEGDGNGPQNLPNARYKIILDFMGNFNKELPDNYFDLVFSSSVLEHLPEDKEVFANVVADINRVLKPGGFSVHLLDVVDNHNRKGFWTHSVAHYLFNNIKTLNSFIKKEDTEYSEDIFWLGQEAYSAIWEPTTKKSYKYFGKPSSLQIIWQKK